MPFRIGTGHRGPMADPKVQAARPQAQAPGAGRQGARPRSGRKVGHTEMISENGRGHGRKSGARTGGASMNGLHPMRAVATQRAGASMPESCRVHAREVSWRSWSPLFARPVPAPPPWHASASPRTRRLRRHDPPLVIHGPVPRGGAITVPGCSPILMVATRLVSSPFARAEPWPGLCARPEQLSQASPRGCAARRKHS